MGDPGSTPINRSSLHPGIGGSVAAMSSQQTWFITGAGRGLGVDIAKAALAAGHNVVATARRADAVTEALGEVDNLLALALDVTDSEQARAAVEQAVERFGRIDVLVNNAGNFVAGFFEEISPAQVELQVGTLLFGTMNVTRAVLPTMRAQRAGKVVSISSVAGVIGQELCSAYAAGKFGVETGNRVSLIFLKIKKNACHKSIPLLGSGISEPNSY